ncbi:hypothetical protein [Burkholderia vietnamiensis]|uniref:hypothetical protein n=1 Tax=Burkholderia vietnamiensis TaxID=60552 RepID=UPI001CF11E10|nr:hypothetical protein [Burkholderia vietnamiensis]MCA8197283.1 hypothetical protein [Burkholderia vietnamiensis]
MTRKSLEFLPEIDEVPRNKSTAFIQILSEELDSVFLLLRDQPGLDSYGFNEIQKRLLSRFHRISVQLIYDLMLADGNATEIERRLAVSDANWRGLLGEIDIDDSGGGEVVFAPSAWGEAASDVYVEICRQFTRLRKRVTDEIRDGLASPLSAIRADVVSLEADPRPLDSMNSILTALLGDLHSAFVVRGAQLEDVRRQYQVPCQPQDTVALEESGPTSPSPEEFLASVSPQRRRSVLAPHLPALRMLRENGCTLRQCQQYLAAHGITVSCATISQYMIYNP